MAKFDFEVQTTTDLTTSASTSTYGDSVTFTAAVTAQGNPVTSGTVSFDEGDTVLGSMVPLERERNSKLQHLHVVGHNANDHGLDSGASSFEPAQARSSRSSPKRPPRSLPAIAPRSTAQPTQRRWLDERLPRRRRSDGQLQPNGGRIRVGQPVHHQRHAQPGERTVELQHHLQHSPVHDHSRLIEHHGNGWPSSWSTIPAAPELDLHVHLVWSTATLNGHVQRAWPGESASHRRAVFGGAYLDHRGVSGLDLQLHDRNVQPGAGSTVKPAPSTITAFNVRQQRNLRLC